MRQFLLAFLLAFSLAVGTQTQKMHFFSVVHAQEQIELNFGQVAKDNEVVGTENYDPEDGEVGFGALVSKILNIVVTVAALILFLMLIWGGIEWISSGGDKSKIEKARNRITQSIIGMIVLAATIAIFAMLQITFNFEVLQFSSTGGGSNDSGTGDGSGDSNGITCVVDGILYNDGGTGLYCTQGAALVRCFPPNPEEGYLSNHNNPCSCVDGAQYQIPGYNFDSC